MVLFNESNCYMTPMQLSQNELMQKFNLAFYEGQNLSKDYLSLVEDEIQDDYLIDYLTCEDDANHCDFDFNDFVRTFDENVHHSNDRETTTSSSCECLTNETLVSDYIENEELDKIDFEDIDLADSLSCASLDLDSLAVDIQDLDNQDTYLPPFTTLTKSNMEFSNFLRTVSDDNLSGKQETRKNEFGHLVGVKSINNNEVYEVSENTTQENQIVLYQDEALLHDDPMLSSSSAIFRKQESESIIFKPEFRKNECKWENCYQIYENQTALVKHIEKCHVEIKRGEEFTCYWENCPRNIRPFNARYKLLIHMRVHSGEKPNKCLFEGCNKAFSRLENLKIHQRSHTGERPYLCQFPTCTKSFSNSSDRAKHQRTHFDTKPYACQVVGCTKKYTDPSSLRKHVKNHSTEEQTLIKKKNYDCLSPTMLKKFLDPNRQKAVKRDNKAFYANIEHNYSNCNAVATEKKFDSTVIRLDLKNKISEKNRRKCTDIL